MSIETCECGCGRICCASCGAELSRGELWAAKVGPYRVTVADNAITISEGQRIVLAYDAAAPAPISEERERASQENPPSDGQAPAEGNDEA